ncbi:hypothetical protein CF327_g6740 [Tilletia walkeri]|nr:hypothetical protein CF327_g6740 [Tilletia walkeri]
MSTHHLDVDDHSDGQRKVDVRGQMSSSGTAPALRPPPALFILGLLVPASMLGTLTRIGITSLFTFAHTPLDPPIIWAQIIGCAVFGGALQNKAYFEAIVLRLDHHPQAVGLQLGTALYTALTSGYCGSVTTFSTWILDDYLAWANYDGVDRSGGKSFLAGIGQSFVTLILSIASLRLGMKLAEEGEPFCMSWVIKILPASLRLGASSTAERSASLATFQAETDLTPSSDHPDGTDIVNKKDSQRLAKYQLLYIATCVFAVGLLVMTSLLAALYIPTRSISVALALSPPGAMLRWYLSRINGKSFKALPVIRRRSTRAGQSSPEAWPYGTFTANMLGVTIVGAAYTALHASRTDAASTVPYSRVKCDVIYSGLEVGLAGCLSTISTFSAELYTLSAGLKTRQAAVLYAFASWGWGLVLYALLVAVPLQTLHRVDRCPAA